MSKTPIHLENRDKFGARLYSPTAGRNKGPIGEVLAEHLPQNAKVLEVASGTGEHAVHVCGIRPDISWQPTDIDPGSRASQNAWRTDVPSQMHPAMSIDTTAFEWWGELESFNAVYCANMIHIAPWEAALGLAAGAGQLLPADGLMMLYGPFQEGEATALSNLSFDANLKRRNPAWGVRDLSSVKHIFADAGLSLSARLVMPAENRLLVFTKRA